LIALLESGRHCGEGSQGEAENANHQAHRQVQLGKFGTPDVELRGSAVGFFILNKGSSSI